MARRGRKQRKPGARGASGRLLDRNEGSVIPPEALARRAEMLGMDVEKRGRGRPTGTSLDKMDGASNLGILKARGVIGLHHYDAGLKLWEAYRRWEAAIESKPRHAKAMDYTGRPVDGPPPVEMDGAQCERAERAFEAAKASVPCWAYVDAAAIDSANILDVYPRLFERSELGERLRAALVRSMDALCRHFNIAIPKKDEGEKAA